jgi:hypothetical protein
LESPPCDSSGSLSLVFGAPWRSKEHVCPFFG